MSGYNGPSRQKQVHSIDFYTPLSTLRPMTQANAYNTAIIGAGIMGLMSAYTLAKRGHTTTIYDPAGFPAQPSASFIAGGMLAPYSEIEHMTTELISAGKDSIKIWQNICPDLIDQKGSLFIAHEQDQYILERFAPHLPDDAAERVTPTDLEPQLGDKFAQGLFLKDEAHIQPAEAMNALCTALKDMDNVTLIKERADPKDLAKHFDHVIDCRGYSAENTDSELRGVKGEIVIVRNTEFTLQRPVRLMHPRYPLYIVPRPDNIFMIGATQIETADDEHVSVRSGLELLSALYSLHPSFGDAQIIELQAGIRPSYKDNLPRIKTDKNIISCNGLFRHGFLLSPIIAKTVGDMIEKKNDTAQHLFMKEAA